MKIALVRKDFSFKGGGAERYAVQLARGLVNSGHEVHVFANRYEPVDGIYIHPVPVNQIMSPLKNWSFAKNIRSALKKNKFDIINGLSQIYPQDVYRLGDGVHRHWLKVRRYPFLARIWSSVSLRHRLILYLEDKIFTPGNYRRIITNSRLCKQHAITYYKVPSHLIDVVYSGIDFDMFNSSVRQKGERLRESLGISKEKTVILFAGMNFARKGLKTLFQAMSQLRNREEYLIMVVGRGSISKHRSLAQRLSLENMVMFCGFQENMPAYYGSADVFVLPTYYDPCANVCLEAMACGLPVITTSENGASELILHGTSGFVLSHPEDSNGLARWLEVLRDRQSRESMGAAAQRQVQPLTIVKNATETLDVYEKVLQDKTKAL